MSRAKIVQDLSRLSDRVHDLRGQRLKLVFIHGSFDVLDAGHVACLESARSLGDALLVGVSSGVSSRPVNRLEERLRVIAALACVDHVIPFDDPGPERLLRVVRPDVYVTAGGHARSALPEWDLVEELGGEVAILPLDGGPSTTRLIASIPRKVSSPVAVPSHAAAGRQTAAPRPADPAWQAARRILCVRLDSLGDVLMTSPALRALVERRPGRSVTLLTSPSGRAAASLVPEVSNTIVYEAPWMKVVTARTDGAAEMDMAARLRAERFDAAVIFTVYSQSALPAALLCHLADIPLRLAHCRENPYRLLTHWVGEPEPHDRVRHEVQRQLDLVSTVGHRTADDRLRLRVPPRAVPSARRHLREMGLASNGRWVVMHPGASAPSRRYPEERFAEVARGLVRDLGLQVVFTGSLAERPMVERIRAAMGAPSHSLAGRLTVAALAALLARAPLLVTNNTGPAHVAAGVGTPVVVLYALTNPQHQPWKVPTRLLSHDVPCRNCYRSVCPEAHHDCLSRVEPAAVLSAVDGLMAETGRSHAPRARAEGAFP
jgi:lipopolysaccharide heptosyltransferase II